MTGTPRTAGERSGARVVCLFGPTASGKTDVISRLSALPVEIINADSMQVYRGMDIGTAKPSPDFLASIPHHLIDIRSPHEQYDVGAFVADARAAIDLVRARGRIPVVSGGTGYYFKHLILGLPDAPHSDPDTRTRVAERLEREGLVALREELERVDSVSAARIGARDGYRVTRALEVFEQTGRPLSSFAVTGGLIEDAPPLLLWLSRPREELARRIGERVRAMFRAGLRDEVEALVRSGCVATDPGMRAIGYREFFAPDASLRPAGEDEAIAEQIETNTRRYAKRQETFFRSIGREAGTIHRISGDDIGGVEALLAGLNLDSA